MKVTNSFIAFILFMFISGCADEGNQTYFTFTFSHTVGSGYLEFSNMKYSNSAGDNYSIETLKYFVSDFTLHRSDGSEMIIDAVHYIDAEDNSTLSFIPTEAIEGGNYSSISFTMGLSSMKNVNGTFPNPPENAMEWPIPMGGGYHYMKLEGKFDSSGIVRNYQAHTGPSMGNSYFINVDLDNSSFTTTGSDVTVNIEMDVNKWWDIPNTIHLNTVTGIMGDQTMQQKLKENGSDVFSIISIK
ncbi:MAG: hypothetical protein HKN92_09625 [Chitinophagales bacterium]|nr:hypothetical protein [Chitinophagales bacterium]